MGSLENSLTQLKALLPQDAGIDEAIKVAQGIDTYTNGVIESRQQMMNDLNASMLKAFNDSMANYTTMVTSLQNAFAQMTKNSGTVPSPESLLNQPKG